MNESRRNKTQLDTNIEANNVDNDVDSWYFGNYYWKDFQYLNPIRQRNNEARQVAKVGDDHHLAKKKMTAANLWAVEVMKGVKQLFYGGTLHGVKYIFEPTFSSRERVTWIIIIVISLAFCIVNIIRLFSKYTSTPFVNVIDSLPTPIWAVPFPTVVICPHLRVKSSFVNVSELKPLEEFFASNLCPRMYLTKLEKRLTPKENILFQKFINGGSLKCSDIVKRCNWPSRHGKTWVGDCCKELFRPVITDYGLCYAFNSLHLSGMTKDVLPWHRSFSNLTGPGPSTWNLDGGYPVTYPPDPNMHPYRVMLAGEAFGLGVELFLNNSEHQYACDGNSLGFTVLIRSPTNHAYTSTVLRIPMDKSTTVEVSPITYKTDVGLRAMDPERRQCYFQNERRLEFFQFYTETNCKMDIFIREAVLQCNCSFFNWPRKAIADPICSTAADFECIDRVRGIVTKQQILAYYDDCEEGKPSQSGSTSCHPSCNDVIYYSQVFYSDLVKEPGDPSPTWGDPKRGELTQLNVHFYEDMFLGQHRHAQYDDYYFVGAIGGLLSLFLGFSIISVAELVFFVLLRPVYLVLKEMTRDVDCHISPSMFSDDGYIGCPRGIENLRSMKDRLSDRVLEQVNDCQELVMLNSFSREASEYQIKKSLQQRISDIASWRWVLQDLSSRLDEGIAALKHEHNALRVIVQRLQNEVNDHCREASRPGALNPRKDVVEDAIMEEYHFLREQKKNFEKMIPKVDKQTAVLEKTKKRIETDLKCKQEALSVEESCAKIDINSLTSFKGKKNKKNSFSPLTRWENRCASLKRAGLSALSNAVITRQQVRGSRVQLSIAAQSCGAKVDAALRRRLHNNTVKLQELQWQREEAVRDLVVLDEELIATEQNVLETMDQERVVEARLVDRTLRPARETTRDDVDKTLREELARLKTFNKRLRGNIDKIWRLQNNLSDTISRIDCTAEDLAQVVRLDQDRLAWRLGEQVKCDSGTAAAPPPNPAPPRAAAPIPTPPHIPSYGSTLLTIKEEDENEDDYPFDD